jgi:hypothetical protein
MNGPITGSNEANSTWRSLWHTCGILNFGTLARYGSALLAKSGGDSSGGVRAAIASWAPNISPTWIGNSSTDSLGRPADEKR